MIGAALVNEDPARVGLLFLYRIGSSPTSNCARASGFSTCHSDGWEPLRTVAARAVARWDVRLQEAGAGHQASAMRAHQSGCFGTIDGEKPTFVDRAARRPFA